MLIVCDNPYKNVIKSAANIPDVNTTTLNELNAYDLLAHDFAVFTKSAIKNLDKKYENK